MSDCINDFIGRRCQWGRRRRKEAVSRVDSDQNAYSGQILGDAITNMVTSQFQICGQAGQRHAVHLAMTMTAASPRLR